jgi:hypothetical protein
MNTEQGDVAALLEEHIQYIEQLKAQWLSQNRVRSRDVYEVMRPEDRQEVHRKIKEWETYITPIAEAWWRERGYGVIWPDDNSKPMQVYKLKTTTT